MAAEIFAGLSALKTAFDMAKGLENIHETVARDRAVIELQKEILAAQSAQAALIETVGALKIRVVKLEAWDAEKQCYELREVSTGVYAYTPKQGMERGQPFHMLCANCYDRGEKSILQATQELQMRRRVHVCPNCETKYAMAHVEPSPSGRVISDYDIFTGKPE